MPQATTLRRLIILAQPHKGVDAPLKVQCTTYGLSKRVPTSGDSSLHLLRRYIGLLAACAKIGSQVRRVVYAFGELDKLLTD